MFVKCITRDNRTLDLFFTTVRDAYTSTALPPLDRSDHNLVLLIAAYRPVVQRTSVTVKTVKRWSQEARETLCGALEAINWNALYEPHGSDIDHLTDCV